MYFSDGQTFLAIFQVIQSQTLKKLANFSKFHSITILIVSITAYSLVIGSPSQSSALNWVLLIVVSPLFAARIKYIRDVFEYR